MNLFTLQPEPPSFTKLYYSASYKTGDDEDSLDAESIQISDDYVEYDSVIVALKEDEGISLIMFDDGKAVLCLPLN